MSELQNKRRISLLSAALALLAVLALCAPVAAMYRPGREQRTVTTAAYEVSVQKNGRTDVSLTSGRLIFDNAFPMVWLEGEDEPEPLAIDARYSRRIRVNDPLGEGQGIELSKDNCMWSLRTYPTESFLLVQVAYVNDTKKPVSVRALYPWCVGPPRKGGFSPRREAGSLDVKTGCVEAPDLESPDPRNYFVAGATEGANATLVGFLAPSAPETTIEHVTETADDGAAILHLRAGQNFDPPVTVQPGDALRSGIVYIGLSGRSTGDAVEAFRRAVRLANE